MYSREVISKWHQEFIESKPTSHDKNEALLEIVRRLSLKAYSTLIKCLQDSNQGHIAEILEFGGGKSTNGRKIVTIKRYFQISSDGQLTLKNLTTTKKNLMKK